ncbi:MAG: hypothetical protein ACI81L_003388 [Verrucomicrobiales bacterium]
MAKIYRLFRTMMDTDDDYPSSAAEMLADDLDAFTQEALHAFVFTSMNGSALLNRYFARYQKKALQALAFPLLLTYHLQSILTLSVYRDSFAYTGCSPSG